MTPEQQEYYDKELAIIKRGGNCKHDAFVVNCIGGMMSNIRFMKPAGDVVFVIDKDGCHVPEGISVDESAKAVIEALDSHIKNLVNPLETNNKALYTQIESQLINGLRKQV